MASSSSESLNIQDLGATAVREKLARRKRQDYYGSLATLSLATQSRFDVTCLLKSSLTMY